MASSKEELTSDSNNERQLAMLTSVQYYHFQMPVAVKSPGTLSSSSSLPSSMLSVTTHFRLKFRICTHSSRDINSTFSLEAKARRTRRYFRLSFSVAFFTTFVWFYTPARNSGYSLGPNMKLGKLMNIYKCKSQQPVSTLHSKAQNVANQLVIICPQDTEITSSVDMRRAQVGNPIGNPKNQCINIQRDHELGTVVQLSRNLEPCWKTETTQHLQHF